MQYKGGPAQFGDGFLNEVIQKKDGTYFILEGNVRSGKTKAIKEIMEHWKIASESLGISVEEFNNTF